MERSNFLRLGRSSTVQGRMNVLNRLKLMSSKGKAIEKYKEELEFLQQQLLETSPLRAFTFEELSAATQGFNRSLVLGEGGFGEVYEGYLIDHSTASTHPENAASKYQHVAVKRLRQGGQQVCILLRVSLAFSLCGPNCDSLSIKGNDPSGWGLVAMISQVDCSRFGTTRCMCYLCEGSLTIVN